MPNPFVETVRNIVEVDVNPEEFDHMTVQLGPYSYKGPLSDCGVDRIYLQIGGSGSVFENIDKKGLFNLITALTEVHELMVE